MTAASLEAVVTGAVKADRPMRMDLGERVQNCERHGEFASKGERFFGRREVWTACPACEELAKQMREAEEQQAAARRERERLEAVIERAAVPRRFRPLRLWRRCRTRWGCPSLPTWWHPPWPLSRRRVWMRNSPPQPSLTSSLWIWKKKRHRVPMLLTS